MTIGSGVHQYIPNPQLGPRVLEIKENACLNACNWCKKIVNQSTFHKKIYQPELKKKAWVHECKTCNKVWDPKTETLKPKVKGRPATLAAKVKVAWYNDPDYKG